MKIGQPFRLVICILIGFVAGIISSTIQTPLVHWFGEISGCLNNSYAYFCGAQGYIVAPTLVACGEIAILLSLRIRRAIIIIILSWVLLVASIFVIPFFSQTYQIYGLSGYVECLLAGAICGWLFLLFNRPPEAVSITQAPPHSEPNPEPTISYSTTGANLSGLYSNGSADQPKKRNKLITMVGAAILATALIIMSLLILTQNPSHTLMNKGDALSPEAAIAALKDGAQGDNLYYQSTIQCSSASSCRGAVCSVYGTNAVWSEVDRKLVDLLHKNGFTTDHNYSSTTINNFRAYDNFGISGYVDAGHLGTMRINPKCTGPDAITQAKKLNGTDPKKYKNFYSISINGFTSVAKPSATPNPGGDPRNYPVIKYPNSMVSGNIGYISQTHHEISVSHRGDLYSMTSDYAVYKLCANYTVYGPYNQTLNNSSITAGRGAEIFLENGCVSIIGTDGVGTLAISPSIDAAVTQYEAGTSSCQNQGSPLKDNNSYQISIKDGRINYLNGTTNITRQLCPTYKIVDKLGRQIDLSAINANNRLYVYHYGNTVIKIAIAK
jgi:hypothetical protein